MGRGQHSSQYLPEDPEDTSSIPLLCDVAPDVIGSGKWTEEGYIAYVALSPSAIRVLGRRAAYTWTRRCAAELVRLSQMYIPNAVVSTPIRGSSELVIFLPGARNAAVHWLGGVLDPRGPVRRSIHAFQLKKEDLRVSIRPLWVDPSAPLEYELGSIYRELQYTSEGENGWLHDSIDPFWNQDELRVATQPILSLRTGAVYGFEALIRSPEGSSHEVPADLFWAAMRSGKVGAMEEMCRDKILRPELLPRDGEKLFVNVDLRYSLGSVLRLITERALPAQRIVVEVSESTVYYDPPSMLRELDACRALGVEVALDDVGAGFTGLQVLAMYPWSYLKIDRRFMTASASNAGHRRLLASLVAFAESTNSLVVAEGIETDDELRICEELRIPLGQGFLLGRPSIR